MRFSFIIGLVAITAGIILPELDQFNIIISLLWIVLFIGGIILPALTAIMLDVVDNTMKTKANSIANLCYNMFGYFPAPALYGILRDATGGLKSRWGMKMLMYMSILTSIFIVLALLTRKVSSVH